MKHRSELLQVYSNFTKMVGTQFSKQIKIFRSDNSLEYTQYVFQAILHSYDTIHQLTCLGISQQNGRAKRKLLHILDTVHALLLFAKVPAFFFLGGEAALHAVHAINRIPSLVIHNQTPYERLFGPLQTITTFTPSVLPVSFFFSRMSITNLSLGLDFVVFLAIEKLKRCISVMTLSLIVFVSPTMLSFGNITPLSSSLTSVPPYLPPLS